MSWAIRCIRSSPTGPNRPLLADYRIFVAEVASTVNEVLLNQYMLQNSDDPKMKASLLYNMLEQLGRNAVPSADVRPV